VDEIIKLLKDDDEISNEDRVAIIDYIESLPKPEPNPVPNPNGVIGLTPPIISGGWVCPACGGGNSQLSTRCPCVPLPAPAITC